ncbi:MAG: glycosyltransferase [Prochlorococcaceae cyanobacterium]
MLSLIVASRNEGDHLQRTLEGILAIEPPAGGLEMSVVDDGSTDGSTAFLEQEEWRQRRRQGWVRLRRHRQAQGVSRARHRGAAGCRGEVLIFLDAHLGFPQADLWRRVEEHFAEGRSDLLAIDCRDMGSGGSNAGHVYTSKRLCHQSISWMPVGSAPLVNRPVPFVNGGFFAIRRSCYAALGGFPLFLQGWGHEDRFLSMLAHYCGFRSLLRQDWQVSHLYRSAAPQHPPDGDLPDRADPLPTDGLPPDLQPEYRFATEEAEPQGVPRMLMNSLRCGVVLYSPALFEQLLEQLTADYGTERLERGLAALEQERPQLERHLAATGLSVEQRDERMAAFFAEFEPDLPMLVEGRLQALRRLPPADALAAISTLPLRLPSLTEPDATHYTVARLFLEGSFAHAVADWQRAMRCQLEALSLTPEYLPSLRLVTLALRSLGRREGLRFWLEHAARVIDRHRPRVGPGPLGAWHPACTNYYMRHTYFAALDREFWQELAWLEQQEGKPAAAAAWLGRLLEQTPGEPGLVQQWQALYGSAPEGAGAGAQARS